MKSTTSGPDELRFGFGENWRAFVDRHLGPEQFEQARRKTIQFLSTDDLRNRSFLDIGCGSGLFSSVALDLGARSVISFDYDPNSVECCRLLREQAGSPEQWQVMRGSILDKDFVARLPKCDVVYSWGVLHHTGSMYEAIDNAASMVQPGGLFLIAIYNKLEYRSLTGIRGSHLWLKLKRLYNRSGWLTRSILRFGYKSKQVLGSLASLRSPAKLLRGYVSKRGMNWSVDAEDWLGGYPYEFASVEEIFRYCHGRFGFELVDIRSTCDTGCNEFLFRKPESVSDVRVADSASLREPNP